MIELANWSLALVFAASVFLIAAAAELGHWLARRAGDRASSNISTMEASILGLLALMISFTFAMALSRYDARRDAVLAEANSIGTTALRARLLPPPHSTDCLNLLREYVQIRLDVTRKTPSPMQMEAAIARSNAIQEALWQQVKTVAGKDSGLVPTGLFVQALNDMIDNQEKRLTAGRNRVPNIVLLALYGITFIALTFTGYAAGLEKRRWRPGVYLTGLVAATVILLIQDLDRSSSGFITVSQQPMIDTAESLAGYSE